MSLAQDNQNDSSSKRGVALVVGAGSGIGQATLRRFALGGLAVVAVKRSSDEKVLAAVDEINTKYGSGSAHFFTCDASNEQQVADLVKKIETEIGELEVVVYNVGANMGHRLLEKTSLR